MAVILEADRHNARSMDYDEAMEVLRGWEGDRVVVIAFVEPGVSLRPFGGTLTYEEAEHRVVRISVDPPGTRITFPVATFHEASWVPGHEGSGLSVVQGATRVDVFREG
jgi:hypothetical protein